MYSKSLTKEIERIIAELPIKCSVEEFQNRVYWGFISNSQKLSEEFIEKFQDKVDWNHISNSQKLSEEFIEKFQNKVDWCNVSCCQKLSEEFIEKFQDRVDWNYISRSQKLSEEFIEKFQDRVHWPCISRSQKLSEEFIEKFQDEVDWGGISRFHKLSKEFIKKFQYFFNTGVQRINHKETTLKEKRSRIQAYAKKHNLEFDGEYLYAFRNHDEWGRGVFNETLSYKKGKYYRDWHCDMNEATENSFGLGVWPKGNTPIKVKVEDWGVEVDREDGKGRVWGFEVI